MKGRSEKGICGSHNLQRNKTLAEFVAYVLQPTRSHLRQNYLCLCPAQPIRHNCCLVKADKLSGWFVLRENKNKYETYNKNNGLAVLVLEARMLEVQ
jgi:hypothetical protein